MSNLLLFVSNLQALILVGTFMHVADKKFYLLFEIIMKRPWIFLFSQLIYLVHGNVTGLITLDSLSFNKTIQHFQYSFVKFDAKVPSGDKHEIFLSLTKDLIEQENILMAEVRIPGKYKVMNPQNIFAQNSGLVSRIFTVMTLRVAYPG